ncbi:MAG: EthD family reductase [Alphaproteobacteria bacterium]|jgi:uncharacterized protein (TIGR02118 family)|nr:EthD family reductase [Alphaproteobacteria bacterium]
MLKLVYCIARRADLSPEEFRRTWLDDHGPLVRRHAEAIGAVRYVQSHTGEEDLNAAFIEGRGLQPAYDGITEVWFNSREEMEAGMASEEGRKAAAALQEDEARFIDFSKSRVFMTVEHEIF